MGKVAILGYTGPKRLAWRKVTPNRTRTLGNTLVTCVLIRGQRVVIPKPCEKIL